MYILYSLQRIHYLHLLHLLGTTRRGSSGGSLAVDASFKMKRKILMIRRVRNGGLICPLLVQTNIDFSLPVTIDEPANLYQYY